MKALATSRDKGMAAFHGDLLQRLQAVRNKARADHVHAAQTFAGQPLERGLGVGLEPAGAAKARLEGQQPLILAQAKRLGQQPASLVAFAKVRVALVEGVARQTVKAHHQPLAPAMLLPVFAHARRQRSDVAGVVVEVAHHSQRRGIATLRHPASGDIKGRGGGAGGVLRIERQDQDAAAAFGMQLIECRRNGRIAVAHGPGQA